MTIAVTTSPTAPTPKSAVTLSAVGTGISQQANLFEYAILSLPTGSTLSTGAIVDANGAPTNVFTPDVAGLYGLTAYSFYQSPDKATKLLKEPFAFTVNVDAGSNLLIKLANGSGATLHLTVATGLVATASLINPTDAASTAAIADAGVIAALAALVGVSVTPGVAGIDLDFATDVRAIRLKYESHRVDVAASVHRAPDSVDALARSAPYSDASAILALNDIIDNFTAHEANLDYHTEADSKNVMLVSKSNTIAGSVVSKADFRRAYGLHLPQVASPASHGAPDGTNTLSAARPLPAMIATFITAVASAADALPFGFTAVG